MKKNAKIISLALVLIMLACTLLSCASSTGKALMNLDGESVSVNLYKLYLSRVKGTLASYGCDVTSEAFWNTVIDMDGSTWDDHYRKIVLEETKQSLIVLKMFSELEKKGRLKFTDEHKEKINERVQTFIDYDANSSAADFNAILGEFGANIDVLKLAYEIELKRDMLITYYFGVDGAQISETVKEKYMRDNYVAFKQILIAKFYYEYECDANGDAIYYTDKGWIAYDKVNGKPGYKGDAPEYDADGNIIYYTEDGRIAYDVANGKRKNILDDNGDPKIVYYTDAQLEEKLALVEKIVEVLPDKDTEKFEYNMRKYAEYANASVEDLEYPYYIKSNETSAYPYINSIKDALAEIEVGGIRVVSSDYGYHIVMRYELEEGAYADKNNATWFEDFLSDITAELLKTHTDQYLDDIVIVDGADKGISMLDIGINFYY